MGTVTEILAEAFNRVKTEHGVTLSRVDFVSAGGVLGLNFRAAATSSPAVQKLDIMPPQASDPAGATHYGRIQGGPVKFWRYENHTLYFLEQGSWILLDALSDAPHCVLVDQLTPLDGSPPVQP